MAVKACRIRGTANGANTFSIPNWQGTGNLSWFHWSANNGVFIEQAGTAPQCIPTAEQFPSAKSPVHVYPNPFDKQVFVYTDKMDASTVSIRVVSLQGQIIPIPAVDVFENGWMLNTQSLAPGIYFLSLFTNGKMYTNQILQKVSE
jgi:hypothetical protein